MSTARDPAEPTTGCACIRLTQAYALAARRERKRLRQKERYHSDPAFRERHKARVNAYDRRIAEVKNAAKPPRQARTKEETATRKAAAWATFIADPENRARVRAERNERYANDPEYRARQLARGKTYRLRKKEKRMAEAAAAAAAAGEVLPAPKAPPATKPHGPKKKRGRPRKVVQPVEPVEPAGVPNMA